MMYLDSIKYTYIYIRDVRETIDNRKIYMILIQNVWNAKLFYFKLCFSLKMN